MESWRLDSQLVESVRNVVIIRQMLITNGLLNSYSSEEKMNPESDLESFCSEVMMEVTMR